MTILGSVTVGNPQGYQSAPACGKLWGMAKPRYIPRTNDTVTVEGVNGRFVVVGVDASTKTALVQAREIECNRVRSKTSASLWLARDYLVFCATCRNGPNGFSRPPPSTTRPFLHSQL